MDKIYILKKGKFISGPFQLEQLKSNGLKESDKIWYEGLADWKDAITLQAHGIAITAPVDATTNQKQSNLSFFKKMTSSLHVTFGKD